MMWEMKRKGRRTRNKCDRSHQQTTDLPQHLVTGDCHRAIGIVALDVTTSHYLAA